MPFPKVSIIFCTKCKWDLRSAWYLQELLQTFGEHLGEASLVPGASGEFRIVGWTTDSADELVIWDRKVDGGFPDSKYLKQRVREVLFTDNDAIKIGGHIARGAAGKNRQLLSGTDDVKCSTADCTDCQ